MSTETMMAGRSRAEAFYGFRVHLAVYVAMNIILLGSNALTGAPWWSIWILGGWTVALLGHGIAALLTENLPGRR